MYIFNHSHEKLQPKISPWLIYIAYILGFWIILPFYFGRLIIKGQENIPKNGSVIVTPSHRSRWDALIIPYAVGRVASGQDLNFMVSSSEMKGIQGWFIRKLGGFPINSKQLIGGGLDHSIEILKKEKMLVIFPEGGIFRGSQVRTLKRGTAHIVIDVKYQQPSNTVKILPISIQYSKFFPSWRTKVVVNIGLPMDITIYDFQDTKNDSERLTYELESHLKRLHTRHNIFEELNCT
ncbi:lysophospholipid acyltransferase family protein [Candidatus Atelocyanobacterium thalassae]|uniref:Phospholipid/glycerol acyltransferase domain-containing protein n=1 Tax=cyanobacterium endosymbiont of Braarudosphaera bigelowii TaxID=1285375 RepID=A0ABM7U5J5_9CHRO|nr:1-acyl-sn-glycerol-3-phosphate acyltransferase [Candidatus Atelocyanobacterium thalassa]BDA40006.1 hypothetical protein CPARK_000084600 [cyanobacterium endosymbiont of Braarudosphaera bigelowii]